MGQGIGEYDSAERAVGPADCVQYDAQGVDAPSDASLFLGEHHAEEPHLACLVENVPREFSEGMAVALFDAFCQLPGGKRSGQLLERFQVAPE